MQADRTDSDRRSGKSSRRGRPAPQRSSAPDGPLARHTFGPRAAAVVLVVLTIAAYANSLWTPFVYDDKFDIVNNPSVHRLWPIGDVVLVSTEGRTALHSRPLVTLSFAVNYALSGLETTSYHVVNLLIHTLAGLTLLGIFRRTLATPALQETYGSAATPLALIGALLWTLHPLQTESVTYITQRYESLMGLGYLLTLYCAIRAATSDRPRMWSAAAVLACAAALSCKEVAVSAPLLVGLHDRAFLAGSFREAWRRRRGLYLGLAADLLVFAAVFPFTVSRSAWAGYSLPVSWSEYALSQFGVIVYYLRLAFWPQPLVLDYAWPVARTASQIVPAAMFVACLLAATIYAGVSRPRWFVCGAWFFLILAPTSSVLPLADLAVEHRLYLPLAAVVAVTVVAGHRVYHLAATRSWLPESSLRLLAAGLCVSVVIGFGALTAARNSVYGSDLGLWQDTVARAPHNARAHYNVGVGLADEGDQAGAVAHYRQALQLSPSFAEAHNNLAVCLAAQGNPAEAVEHFRQALETRPTHAEYQYNLGNTLVQLGRLNEAVAVFQRALEFAPQDAQIHNNLGDAFVRQRRFDDAAQCFRRARELNPGAADVCFNLGDVLVRQRKLPEAATAFQEAVALAPQDAESHVRLANVLIQQGRAAEALTHWREASRLRPNDVSSLLQAAWVLATNPDAAVRNGAEALDLAERAVRLSGQRNPALLDVLAAAQAELGRYAAAAELVQQALALLPAQADSAWGQVLHSRLALYQRNKPFRDPAQAPARK